MTTVTVRLFAWGGRVAAALAVALALVSMTAAQSRPAAKTYYVVAVDEVGFDPYWRDACLSLAHALEPLGAIAQGAPTNGQRQVPGTGSKDEAKRRADAGVVAKEVAALRRRADERRTIRVIWVGTEEEGVYAGECKPIYVSQDCRDAIEPGAQYTLTVGPPTTTESFATRLRPLPDPDVEKSPDVAAAANSLRGRWLAADLTVATRAKKVDSSKNPGRGRRAPALRASDAFDRPPDWSEGPDAMRSITIATEGRPPDPGVGRPNAEVSVRFTIPFGVDRISRVGFHLYERTPEGANGKRVSGDAPLVAWGYGGRPALAHVPVKAIHADGYNVEMVEAKYR